MWKVGDAMKRIVVNMQNALFSDAISGALSRSGNEFDVYTVDSVDKVVDECRWIAPYAKIRDAVLEKFPDCKIVLIVDENADKSVACQVKQAKKDGLIDQFIYGSISASYLADIVDSL